MSCYNALWCDGTTLGPYSEETSYENSLLVQQSGALALSSLIHVFKYVDKIWIYIEFEIQSTLDSRFI